ncbi:hypothetical protein F0562_030450 [Nyssa sinensis]|uniref:Uncharacterized protein n=1 Tax=Nyssa sinensis TaxID=561372 RepID=A0A5J5B106_9ASTE|nr:hypothetical protein F0562_030450 [Nyssa sinensis]
MEALQFCKDRGYGRRKKGKQKKKTKRQKKKRLQVATRNKESRKKAVAAGSRWNRCRSNQLGDLKQQQRQEEKATVGELWLEAEKAKENHRKGVDPDEGIINEVDQELLNQPPDEEEAKSNAEKWRTTPINHYDKLCEMFPKDKATGAGAETAKEKRRRWVSSTSENPLESIHNIDQLVSQNEVTLENFICDLDDDVENIMSPKAPSSVPSQSAT